LENRPTGEKAGILPGLLLGTTGLSETEKIGESILGMIGLGNLDLQGDLAATSGIFSFLTD